jgi:aminoglycoside 6'-N-acetyltransferase I
VPSVTSTSGGVKSSVFDVEPSGEVPSTLTSMISEVLIRLAQPSDCTQLARLREALWPDSSIEEHILELSQGKASLTVPAINLVAEATDGKLVGFLEVGLRSHADGCDLSRPIGFIEGWYVAEDRRHQGIGRKLLIAAEDWARSQGCAEMASDTPIDNKVSQLVHEALGYLVVDRCVHYRRPL